MFKDLPKQLIITMALFLVTSHFTLAQDFFKDYKHYTLKSSGRRIKNFKAFNKSIEIMKQAVRKYENLTKTSIFRWDTLFMIHYYSVETGEHIHVLWNRSESFYYRYSYNRTLIVEKDASGWVKGYKPEFRKWVETVDTSSYGKYGRQSSWFDAPSISFTVATNVHGHWKFISSGSYSNNVDRLN